MSVFEHATQKADSWVKDMMRELPTDDPHLAYHALGAGLQTVRDRLPVEEAAQLAAQLPLLVKGLFYEGWRPASTPARIRHPEEFIALYQQKAGDRYDLDPERGLAAFLDTLSRHVTTGQLDSLKHSLPQSLAQLVR
jgi:uncharacterized protein (DUF2267 family)